MKHLALAALLGLGFALPANATTFDFTGPDGTHSGTVHDEPVGGEGGSCTAGDHCGLPNLMFSKDGFNLTVSGLENVNVVVDNGLELRGGDAERVIEDANGGNGGAGVIGEEITADPDSFDGSEEQVNSVNDEAIVFTFTDVVTLTGWEMNGRDHTDCSGEGGNACGVYTLFVDGVFADADWAGDVDGASFTGSVFTFVAGFDPEEIGGDWYIGGLTVVPEPATWMMMILGFGLIAMQLRRRERMHVELA